MADFTSVFEALRDHGYGGPASIHCEFHLPADGFDAAVAREAGFFTGLRRRIFG